MPKPSRHPHPFDSSAFDQWCAEYCARFGLSEHALARLLGLAESHLHRMRTGEQKPSFQLFSYLRRVAGVPFDAWILDSHLD